MGAMDTTFSLSLKGKIKISERGEEKTEGHGSYYPSIELLDSGQEEEINLRIDYLEGAMTIEMLSYHIENTETKRAFHSAHECTISHAELQAMRNFITFLIGEIE